MCVYILVSPVSVAVLVAFCGASYLEVVKSREDQVPTKGDFLAALLPLVCIPALLSLCSGWLKWLVNFFSLKLGIEFFSNSIPTILRCLPVMVFDWLPF